MDEQRTRIQDDVRGLIAGEIRCDDVFLQLYSSDASVYQIKPLGVVRPRLCGRCRSLRAICVGENQIPIHARGAGTGLAGESLGPGLVLDFSSHFRRILDVGRRAGFACSRAWSTNGSTPSCSASAVLFGPDPAMSNVTTMGSVVAIDAAGAHWLKYGSARSNILKLQVVLADGSVMEVGREPLIDGKVSRYDPTANAI